MEALGLGLEAEERGGEIGLTAEDFEAVGEPKSAVLGPRDFDVIADLAAFEDLGIGWADHGGFQAVGEEAGFEGVHAEHGVLGEGDALHGEALLGVLDFSVVQTLFNPMNTRRLHYDRLSVRPIVHNSGCI